MKRKYNAFIISFTVSVFLAVSGSLHGADSQPGIYTMKIGAFQIYALQDAAFDMQANLFKTGDPAIIKKYMPEGKLPASESVYIVKTGKNIVLIDTGIGENDSNTGKMIERMNKIGVKPADIDTILITHAHFDHVGGLLKNKKAVFPKAKLMISKAELESFSDEVIAKLPADIKGYFIPANTAAKIYKEKVVSFVPGSQIVEGITSVDTAGHTSGSVSFLIESEGNKFLMIGDLLHVSEVQFPYPDYSLVYDSDPVKAAEMRKKILKWASDEKLIIAGVHIPFPGIGTVRKEKSGFTFTPIK